MGVGTPSDAKSRADSTDVDTNGLSTWGAEDVGHSHEQERTDGCVTHTTAGHALRETSHRQYAGLEAITSVAGMVD